MPPKHEAGGLDELEGIVLPTKEQRESASEPNVPGPKTDDNEIADEGGENDHQRKGSSTRVATGKAFVAGVRSKAITFGDCHETGAWVAALVGFDQMSQLRNFPIPAPFLKYYLLYDTSDQWSHGMRSTGALEQIRDVWLNGNARKTFSTSFAHLKRLEKNVPVGKKTALETSVVDKEAKDQYLTQILTLMVEDFSLATPTFCGEEQKKYAEQLIALKDKISSVPGITGRTIPWPQMKFPEAEPASTHVLYDRKRVVQSLRKGLLGQA